MEKNVYFVWSSYKLHELLVSISQGRPENEKKLNLKEISTDSGSTLRSASPARGPAASSEIQEITLLLDNPDSQTKKTDETMKNHKLSTFEMEIIDLFDILKEILESTVEITSSYPATSLDLSLATLRENTCFLLAF